MEVTLKKRIAIEAAVEDAGGIVAYAKQNHINKGHVSLAYNGVYLSPKMARVMGFPSPVPVMPCNNPDCPEFGEAHVYDCREQVVKPRPRPRKPDPTKQTLSTRQDKEIIEAAKSAAGMPWSEFVRRLATGEIEVTNGQIRMD